MFRKKISLKPYQGLAVRPGIGHLREFPPPPPPGGKSTLWRRFEVGGGRSVVRLVSAIVFVSLKIKDIFKQHGDLRCYIHEVPKNNWLIFRMGEVDTQMRGFELYVSHESAHWDFNGYYGRFV